MDPMVFSAASRSIAAGRSVYARGPRHARRGVRSGDMASGWGSAIAITQDATRLTVEYAVFSRYDLQPPLKFTYRRESIGCRCSRDMAGPEGPQRSGVGFDRLIRR
jgi:hypothetical protein